jgi:hypothetical protein
VNSSTNTAISDRSLGPPLRPESSHSSAATRRSRLLSPLCRQPPRARALACNLSEPSPYTSHAGCQVSDAGAFDESAGRAWSMALSVCRRAAIRIASCAFMAARRDPRHRCSNPIRIPPRRLADRSEEAGAHCPPYPPRDGNASPVCQPCPECNGVARTIAHGTPCGLHQSCRDWI